jgi:hypothetical protein
MQTLYKCEVTIAIRQNLYVLTQISHLSKLLKMSKKWKHELHAIFYAKRIQIKYIHNFLTLKELFLNLFSLAIMPCVHQ